MQCHKAILGVTKQEMEVTFMTDRATPLIPLKVGSISTMV